MYSLFSPLVALLVLLVGSLDCRRLGDTDHEACCGDEKAIVVPIPPIRPCCGWNVGFEAANTSSTATTPNPEAIDERFFFLQRWPEEDVIQEFERLIVAPEKNLVLLVSTIVCEGKDKRIVSTNGS